MTDIPYSPLEKANLARSIQTELLSRDPVRLDEIGEIRGAGIYVLYYLGSCAPYARIRKDELPIYIGKAIPKGGRKGGLGADASQGRAIASRLGHHMQSIDEVANLDVRDFRVRYLVLDDIWIPLGENMLIEEFKPLWNRAIDGFGNKDPGRRRANQFKSPWDVLHPGRKFAEKLAAGPLSEQSLTTRVADYLAGREPSPLPKVIEEQQAEEIARAQDAADEA